MKKSDQIRQPYFSFFFFNITDAKTTLCLDAVFCVKIDLLVFLLTFSPPEEPLRALGLSAVAVSPEQKILLDRQEHGFG